MDIRRMKQGINALGGKQPTDAEMLKLLKDAGMPDLTPEQLAAASPEHVHAFGFFRLMEESTALARALVNATNRCRVCEEGKPKCAQCVADLMPVQEYAVTMAVICHMVASRAVADGTDKGDDHGPFEVH